jgi:hypothetical protein
MDWAMAVLHPDLLGGEGFSKVDMGNSPAPMSIPGALVLPAALLAALILSVAIGPVYIPPGT